MHVLGGRHLFQAVRNLHSKQTCNPCYRNLRCKVYHMLTGEEALRVATHHNTTQSEHRALSFQDKCRAIRSHHLFTREQISLSLGITGSTSVLLSTSQYCEENWQLFNRLADNFSTRNTSIPQLLFRKLQGTSEEQRKVYLNLAIEEGMQTAIDALVREKQISKLKDKISNLYPDQVDAIEDNELSDLIDLEGLSAGDRLHSFIQRKKDGRKSLSDSINIKIAITLDGRDISNQTFLHSLVEEHRLAMIKSVSNAMLNDTAICLASAEE